jgi:hypothetical protein
MIGGKALVGFAGGDATVPFYMTHKSALALQTLKKVHLPVFFILRLFSIELELCPTMRFLLLLKDYAKWQMTLRRSKCIITPTCSRSLFSSLRGYFNCSKVFLAFQFIQIGLITALGWWLYHQLPGFFGATVAAIVVAFAQGQVRTLLLVDSESVL